MGGGSEDWVQRAKSMARVCKLGGSLTPSQRGKGDVRAIL